MRFLLLENDHVLRLESDDPLELDQTAAPSTAPTTLVKVLKGHYPVRRDTNQRRNAIARSMQLRRLQIWT